MKLTNKEKDILNLALTKLDEYYDEREKTCREFKWIYHDYLPQAGDGYLANKNVFDIQDKTIKDIKKAKEEGRQTIMKLINGL
jgi:uridine kinase